MSQMSDADFVKVFREIWFSPSGHVLAALLENYSYYEPTKYRQLIDKMLEAAQ